MIRANFQVKECRKWIVSFLAHVKFDFDFIKEISRSISLVEVESLKNGIFSGDKIIECPKLSRMLPQPPTNKRAQQL